MADSELANYFKDSERQRLEQTANKQPLNLRNMLVGGGAIGGLTGGTVGRLIGKGKLKPSLIGVGAGAAVGLATGAGIDRYVGLQIAKARELLASAPAVREEEINRRAMKRYIDHMTSLKETRTPSIGYVPTEGKQ